MALEVADYISELISANPTVADPISQGDDHIRLLKQVLQNALPGNTAPLTFTGNMTLNGDYNGTNAVMTGDVSGNNGTFTGTLQGATVTDGTYSLGDVGLAASAVDAWGLILNSTTTDGVGLFSVTNFGAGEHELQFDNLVSGADKQVVVYTGDQQGVGSNGLYHVDGYNAGTGAVRIFGRTAVSGSVVNTTKYPMGAIRLIFT